MKAEKLKAATERIKRELEKMSPEEFAAELEKHKYDDITRALMYAWDPDMKDDYWKDVAAHDAALEGGKEKKG